MSDSDYVIKATLKKLGEKFNQVFSEKIEEVNFIAQDIPETFKKEFEKMKEEIILEAKRMEEKAAHINHQEVSSKSDIISESQDIIKEINEQIDFLNNKLD